MARCSSSVGGYAVLTIPDAQWREWPRPPVAHVAAIGRSVSAALRDLRREVGPFTADEGLADGSFVVARATRRLLRAVKEFGGDLPLRWCGNASTVRGRKADQEWWLAIIDIDEDAF